MGLSRKIQQSVFSAELPKSLHQAGIASIHANNTQPLVATESDRAGGVQFLDQHVHTTNMTHQRAMRARRNSFLRQAVKPNIFF